MYIVPTAGTTGSCVERGVQRRGRLHKNVCGIPQGRGLLLSFLSLGTVAECSLPLSFAPAAFVVSFIIPLICCAPARDHHNRSRMYFFLPGLPQPQQVHVGLCVCVQAMCVFFRRGMSDSSACFLFSPSFLRSFSRSQSCCLFPHTQRFLRAALIFAAARGHYQLIDYFDCYLIPPLGRGTHMCKCSLSLSLFLSLGPGPSLFLLCAVAGSQP